MSAQIAADLRAAADVLERDGWTVGDFHRVINGRICHCASGALALATGAHADIRIDETGEAYQRSDGPPAAVDRWNTARYFLAAILDGAVPNWNDYHAGSAERVIARLREAADTAEQA